MAKVSLNSLIKVFSDIRRKGLNDAMLKTLIQSLWRDENLMFREKVISYKENQDTGFIKNSFSDDILFGTAIGQNNFIGANNSSAFGVGLKTSSFSEIALGSFNTKTAGSIGEFFATERLITIGNGQNDSARSDAFLMYKSGYSVFKNAVTVSEYNLGNIDPLAGTLQFTPASLLQLYQNSSWHKIGILHSGVNNQQFAYYNSATKLLHTKSLEIADVYLLQNALNAKSNTNHSHAGIYEPVITKGTTSQYFRGDMSLASFPTSMPASDVYAWAKAATKPSYTYSEVGAAAAAHTHDYSTVYAAKNNEAKVAMAGNTSLVGYLNDSYFSIIGGVITPKLKTINGNSIAGTGDLTVSANWGAIGGDISQQNDLQTALTGKAAKNGNLNNYFQTSYVDITSSFTIKNNGGSLSFYSGSTLMLSLTPSGHIDLYPGVASVVNVHGRVNADSFYMN